jgi:hypothetical protein
MPNVNTSIYGRITEKSNSNACKGRLTAISNSSMTAMKWQND